MNIDPLIQQAAASFGTPLYAYDANVIDNAVADVRNQLPEFTVAYSVKANPSLAICQRLARMGLIAEVASQGELILAQRAGYPMQSIIFAGPSKTDKELDWAVNHRIFTLNVESVRELHYLANRNDADSQMLLYP